jgi:pentatricopeptide repeat protein
VQALRCAVAIQDALRAQPDSLCLRIGVHQGEVVPEGDDLLGDGVIVAARLEPLAEPGGICISARVREDAAGKMALEVDDLGETALKNIAAKIRVLRVRLGTPDSSPSKPALALPNKPSIAVLPFQNMSGDPEQEYFVDGMVEEIITALSSIRWLLVMPRRRPLRARRLGTQERQPRAHYGAGQLIDTATGCSSLGPPVRRVPGRRLRSSGQGGIQRRRGGAYFLCRRFDEAVPKLLLAIRDDPNFPQTYRVLASCYAHMGRLDDAREVVARLRAMTPVVRLDASFLRNAEHRELLLSGLRLALGEME